MRGKGDSPSVGLIICKSKDKTVVEWSLKDIQKPLGVATYQLEEVVERTVLELKQREKKEIIVPIRAKKNSFHLGIRNKLA